MKHANPKTPPPVPADVERYLERLGLPPETRAYAKFLFPTAATERVERLRNLSELVRHALEGREGAAVKAAVQQVLDDKSLGRVAQLEQCGRIFEKRRATQRHVTQTPPRGMFAP